MFNAKILKYICIVMQFVLFCLLTLHYPEFAVVQLVYALSMTMRACVCACMRKYACKTFDVDYCSCVACVIQHCLKKWSVLVIKMLILTVETV